MARASIRNLALQAAAAVLIGGLAGGSLGLASAQEQSGWLNPECAGRCAAKGYEAEFCGNVCWVPDPVEAAEGDRLDWKCFEACVRRGERARACVASCRR